MREYRRVWRPALTGSLMVLVLVAGIISAAAAVTDRRRGNDVAVHADNETMDADGRVRAAGGRLAIVDTRTPATTAQVVGPPGSTSTTVVPTSTVTTARPGSTSSTSVPVTTPRAPTLVVQVPYAPGRTSWTAEASGVTITLKVDKADPGVGEAVRFDAEASSATRACCVLVLRFGDGAMYGQPNEKGPCAPGAPEGPGPVRASTTHTYERANQYMFEVRAFTGNCKEDGGVATLFGTLQVGPPSTGQGPALPNVTLSRTTVPGENGQPAHQGDRTWAAVVALAKDDDGWVRTARLDWGDGTPPQVFPSGMTCRPTITGWPGGTQIVFGSVGSGEGIHHYAAPGTYTVTVTAVSTGCDGTVTQTGTGSLVWDAA